MDTFETNTPANAAKHEDVNNILPFGDSDESSDNTFARLSSAIENIRKSTIVPIFLRMPPHKGGGSPFLQRYINYYAARRLTAGNLGCPPRVRAYDLTLPGADRGVVLIDYLSLLHYEVELWNSHSPHQFPVVSPAPPPLYLPAPPKRQQCPYTGLKPTKFYEVISTKSPYGATGIKTTMIAPAPGAKLIKVVDTASLIHFIRTLPPPSYSLPKGF